MYQELNTLNNINKRGIYKKWVYESITSYNFVCDYLQKINYSIQDINKEIAKDNLGMKEIVFIIVLIDWIKDSYTKITEKIRVNVMNGFIYNKNSILKLAKEYFVAIRSYIVAHPMNTTRHSKFGFDGNFICVDIRNRHDLAFLFVKENNVFYIDYDGIHNGKNKTHNFYLYSYSNEIDGGRFFKCITFNVDDILNVARLYIDALYELNSFLNKAKKKDYEV